MFAFKAILLVLSVTVVVFGDSLSVTSTPTVTSSKEKAIANLDPITAAKQAFYSTECIADTFVPSIATFASIWAVISFVLVIVSSSIYLMYTCFNKFVTAMVSN